MKLRTCLAAFALTCGVASLANAQVEGQCLFKGQAPQLPSIDMSANSACVQAHGGQTKVPDPSLVIGPNGEVANVIVSITLPDGSNAPKTLPAGDVALDQKGCMYEPHVVTMMVGQKLAVGNSDPFLHNVHCQSDNTPFNTAMPNLVQPPKVLDKSKQPNAAEYIHFKCDVHPWMSAWVGVFDHPYFAVTDKDGKFTIPAGLPDGTYTITYWQERLGDNSPTAQVTVKGGKATADFKFADDAFNAKK